MLTPTNGTPGAAPTNPTKQRTGQLPTNPIALSVLATKAAEAWATSELPALLWLPKADLTALAATFAQHRDDADAAGDQRTPQSKRLKVLDKLFDKNLRYVKGYLAEAHDDDEGRGYFPEFGIVRESKNYQLPTARAERVKSLNKLLAALTTHDFDKKKYGTAYWQPLATEYAQLVQASSESAGQRSEKVSGKDQSEGKVRKAMRALIHHIKANYPDTFEAQLRVFGFQKESY